MLLFLCPSGNNLFSQYFTSLLHWTSNYRRLWENRESGPASFPVREFISASFISASFWHDSICTAPSPELTSLLFQLELQHQKDAPEPEDHNFFTLTLKKGALHCKAASQPLWEAPPGLQRKVQSIVCLTQVCNNSLRHHSLQPKPPNSKAAPLAGSSAKAVFYIAPTPKLAHLYSSTNHYLLYRSSSSCYQGGH